MHGRRLSEPFFAVSLLISRKGRKECEAIARGTFPGVIIGPLKESPSAVTEWNRTEVIHFGKKPEGTDGAEPGEEEHRIKRGRATSQRSPARWVKPDRPQKSILSRSHLDRAA